jgi:predicted nucleic acid-binding protein
MIQKVTLDTNVIMEYWNNGEKSDSIMELLRLSSEGEISLAITSRIKNDIPKPPLFDKINNLPKLGIEQTGSVARLGEWRLGEDRLGSENFVNFSKSIDNVSLGPNIDWRDWDHIHAHYLQYRDVFLTWDNRILSVAKELENKFSITIMKPEDFIKMQAR